MTQNPWVSCRYYHWAATFRSKYSHYRQCYTQPIKFLCSADIELAKLKAHKIFAEKYTGKDAHGMAYKDYELWAITRLDILDFFPIDYSSKSRKKVTAKKSVDKKGEWKGARRKNRKRK
jgi:hypothetical protein